MQAPTGSPTTLLFVRHAEVHNPDRVLYGRLARFPIGPTGRAQAEAVAAYLSGRDLAAIYSSPLLRARQTAAAIAAHHPTATRHVSALVHEVGTSWQGTRFTEFPPGFSTYANGRGDLDESLEQVRARMERFVALARRRHAGQQIVCVSHGDPITVLRVALSGRPLTVEAIRGADYAQLCSITEVVYSPGEERPTITLHAAPNATEPRLAADK